MSSVLSTWHEAVERGEFPEEIRGLTTEADGFPLPSGSSRLDLDRIDRWASAQPVKTSPEWRPWFAWRPVTLLTFEIAWLRWIRRRPHVAGAPFSSGKWDYAN